MGGGSEGDEEQDASSLDNFHVFVFVFVFVFPFVLFTCLTCCQGYEPTNKWLA